MYTRLPFNKFALVSLDDRCEVGCAFCFRADRGADRMSVALFARILSRLFELGLRGVCLTGGEPANHPDFVEFVRLSRQFGMDCSVVSSAREGRSLNVLQKAATLLNHVTISADSMGAGIVGGVRRTPVDAAVALECMLPVMGSMHVVVWQITSEEAKELASLARVSDFEMEFSPLYISNSLRDKLGLSIDRYLQQLDADLAVLEQFFEISERLRNVVAKLKGRLDPTLQCICESTRIYVSADGYLRRCPYSESPVRVTQSRAEINAALAKLFQTALPCHLACAAICREVVY
jgi:molybdenum cofactor biosynthesis enzyme MoaA